METRRWRWESKRKIKNVKMDKGERRRENGDGRGRRQMIGKEVDGEKENGDGTERM